MAKAYADLLLHKGACYYFSLRFHAKNVQAGLKFLNLHRCCTRIAVLLFETKTSRYVVNCYRGVGWNSPER